MKPNEKKSWTNPQVKKFAESGGQSVIRYGPQCGVRTGQECIVRVGTECAPARFGTSCAPRLGGPCGVEIPE